MASKQLKTAHLACIFHYLLPYTSVPLLVYICSGLSAFISRCILTVPTASQTIKPAGKTETDLGSFPCIFEGFGYLPRNHFLNAYYVPLCQRPYDKVDMSSLLQTVSQCQDSPLWLHDSTHIMPLDTSFFFSLTASSSPHLYLAASSNTKS